MNPKNDHNSKNSNRWNLIWIYYYYHLKVSHRPLCTRLLLLDHLKLNKEHSSLRLYKNLFITLCDMQKYTACAYIELYIFRWARNLLSWSIYKSKFTFFLLFPWWSLDAICFQNTWPPHVERILAYILKPDLFTLKSAAYTVLLPSQPIPQELITRRTRCKTTIISLCSKRINK